MWGRTHCDGGRCATGDCGHTSQPCQGAGGVPPATLAEFTLNGSFNRFSTDKFI